MKSPSSFACLAPRLIAGFFLPSILAVTAFGADDKPGLGLKLVAEGLVSPSILIPLADGSGRNLVADQVGTVQILGKDGILTETLFLDLRERMVKLRNGFDERGLLGLALHPGFRQNGKLYVFYSAPRRESAPADWDCTSHLSEFKISEKNREQVDLKSERILLEIDKPDFNHNCGRIAFGPDGFLYIGVGDGGNGNDSGKGHSPQGNGQDTMKLLGKFLRLDVDHQENGKPYGIPKDNPFADGKKGLPEIYAYGVRNSWGISFDRGGAHELFAADVGQSRFEEVNIIVRGGNYGWNIREGLECFNPKDPLKPLSDCPKVGANGEPLIDPIIAYKNATGFPKDPEVKGISVTGGYVYRGKALPQLAGKYIFADWSRNFGIPSGTMMVATRPSSPSEKQWSLDMLDMAKHPKGRLTAFITALGEDGEGELYFLTNGSNQLVGKNGKIFKLVPE